MAPAVLRDGELIIALHRASSLVSSAVEVANEEEKLPKGPGPKLSRRETRPSNRDIRGLSRCE